MPYNPWSGYRMTGTWQDHMSYSLGGEDYPLAYGTELKAPAAGTLRTSGGSGEFKAGWVGSAGRRSILELDNPIGEMVAIVVQHQSAFGGEAHYVEGELFGWSGASANGKDWGGDVHLHVHGLRANGTRIPFTSALAGGGNGTPGGGLSPATQGKLQQLMTNLTLYSGPIDNALGTNGWKAIQQWLTNLGLYSGPIDGDPGENTFKALQTLAQQGGYTGPVDGDIGPNSDAGLSVYLDSRLAPPTPTVPAADWAAWQRFLVAYGYTGPIDGDPGTNTFLALQTFLAAMFAYTGPIDGEPGDFTWQAFARAVAAGYPVGKPVDPAPAPEDDVFPEGETGLTGVDVGTSQKDFDFQKFRDAGGDFAIIKMGGGNAGDSPYVAPEYLAQLSRARRVEGLIVGHYWMNGNKNGLTPTTSAQYFARYASIMEGDLIALDIEAIDGVPAYTPDEALEFIHEFQKTFPGAKFLIYVNRGIMREHDWSKVKAEGHELWIATLDGTRNPELKYWSRALLVQFNIGKTAGSAVNVDQNIATADLTSVRYDRPDVIPDPEPEPVVDRLPAFLAELQALIAKHTEAQP